MKVDIDGLKDGDVLYENNFLEIKMINKNYPFLRMKRAGSVIVPFDKDGNVYLLERERVRLGHVYELPRGFVDLNEVSAMAALRELKEESGLTLVNEDDLDFLGHLQPDTGVMDNEVSCYCVEVEPTTDYFHRDTDEEDEVHRVIRVTKKELVDLIKRRKISDSYTLSGLMLFNTIKK